MSFEMSVALARKLLKIRDSNTDRLESARSAVVKAHEKKPHVNPKIKNLQKDLVIVKEIQIGCRQDTSGKVANLMGVSVARKVNRSRLPIKFFK